MKFEKGSGPMATTEGEFEFIRAFADESFIATGLVVASGTGYWTNARGSRGHPYIWVLARAVGFTQPVYAKSVEMDLVFYPGATVKLRICPRLGNMRRPHDRFGIEVKFPHDSPDYWPAWEEVVPLLSV